MSLSPQRLQAIAEGAEPHPPVDLVLKPEDAMLIAVTDTAIGAINYAGNALGKFGFTDTAKLLEATAQVVARYGKLVIEQAMNPPRIEIATPGAPPAHVLERVRRVKAALVHLRAATAALGGEG